MADEVAETLPADFALIEDALSFENLHVDIGPEVPEEITEIHWYSQETIEVSVHLFSAEILQTIGSDAFLQSIEGSQTGDWMFE